MTANPDPRTGGRIQRRVERLDWDVLEACLDERGFALTAPLLTVQECRALRALYGQDGRFRTRIDMARHRFGVGDYAYFDEPLPEAVAALRRGLYPHLAGIANRWQERLGAESRFPDELDAFSAQCRQAGQTRPTPLLLRYEPGGYNCLHQDLYGEVAFPLQLTILLSAPGVEFEGGEFLLVEQRPRMQSRGQAIVLGQGQAVVFPNAVRPAQGSRGVTRAQLRHGVSEVRSGLRYCLGIIFHDAK